MSVDSSPSASSQTLIDPEQARPLQLMYLATGFAIMVFFVILTVLASSSSSGTVVQAGASAVAFVLSKCHLVIALGVYRTMPAMFGRLSRPRQRQGEAGRNTRLAKASPTATTTGSAFSLLRKALIVRLAVMESVALFGLTVSLVAAHAGVLKDAPIYWLNLFSCVVFVGFLAVTFPTADRLHHLLRGRVFGNLA